MTERDRLAERYCLQVIKMNRPLGSRSFKAFCSGFDAGVKEKREQLERYRLALEIIDGCMTCKECKAIASKALKETTCNTIT